MYSTRHKRLVAKCYEEITIYDYKRAKKTTLPPHLVHLLQGMFKRQVEVGTRTKSLVRAVERYIRTMEQLPDKPEAEMNEVSLPDKTEEDDNDVDLHDKIEVENNEVDLQDKPEVENNEASEKKEEVKAS